MKQDRIHDNMLTLQKEKSGNSEQKKTYMISEVTKLVGVEQHVLRYWEEELGLKINRNELGHREYTEGDVEQLKEIRELKQKGLQLKGIYTLMQGGEIKKVEFEPKPLQTLQVTENNIVQTTTLDEKQQKSVKLQQLLQQMIAEAVKTSNKQLCEELKGSILKELDYQFRLQDEKEEERERIRQDKEDEHFRKLDELLRSRSNSMKRKKHSIF